MKKLFSLLLLATITMTAYADKNHKPVVKDNTIKPQPAPATIDKYAKRFNQYWDGERYYDPRMERDMSVNIDSATAAKYGATRPTMPTQSNPYKFSTNNPVKQ